MKLGVILMGMLAAGRQESKCKALRGRPQRAFLSPGFLAPGGFTIERNLVWA